MASQSPSRARLPDRRPVRWPSVSRTRRAANSEFSACLDRELSQRYKVKAGFSSFVSLNGFRAGIGACAHRFVLCETTDHGSACDISITMTKLEFKGGWNEVKGKLKQKYAQLSDDDVAFAEGKEDELLGRLQQRLGKSKEDLRKEIESL
jgi:uncharacterized protein YjbJ (UPF0337 family)